MAWISFQSVSKLSDHSRMVVSPTDSDRFSKNSSWELSALHNIDGDRLLRHKDVSPWRKIDIMDTFWNWQFATWQEYKSNLYNMEPQIPLSDLEAIWKTKKTRKFKDYSLDTRIKDAHRLGLWQIEPPLVPIVVLWPAHTKSGEKMILSKLLSKILRFISFLNPLYMEKSARQIYYEEHDLETRTEVSSDWFRHMWGVKYNHVHDKA